MISLLHDMLCAHIACRILDAEIQGLCRDAVFLAPQQRLISVEHSRAAFLQSLQNFHLGIADALTGAEEFNVCGADIGNDGNRRLCLHRHAGDFFEIGHAHLDHRRLG